VSSPRPPRGLDEPRLPSWAVQSHPEFRFLDPAGEGRFLALREVLSGYAVDEASTLVEAGAVRAAEGTVIGQPAAKVLPVRGSPLDRVSIYLHHEDMKTRRAGGRRTDIADAILRIAGREGIGALTMERLGREVGVTSGALFRHFPSRTAMLNEAARRAVALLEETFPAPELPALERLRRLVVARSKIAAEHGAVPQLVFSEQFGKALPPKGARAVRGIVLRTHAFAAAALREAADNGETRRDIPAEELALTVMGVILARALFGALRDGSSGNSEPDPEAAWGHILRLIGSREPAAARPPRIEGGRT
jgi:TetR/AcrR family transcriptional regulator, fatty acid metabolism regulator protein